MAKKKHKVEPKAASDKGKDAGAPDSDKGRVLAMLALAAALGVAGGALVVGRLPVRDLLPGARAAASALASPASRSLWSAPPAKS